MACAITLPTDHNSDELMSDFHKPCSQPNCIIRNMCGSGFRAHMDGAVDPPQAAHTGCCDQGSAASTCSNCHISLNRWMPYLFEIAPHQTLLMCQVCYSVAKLWQQLQTTQLRGDERALLGADLGSIANRVQAVAGRAAAIPLEDRQ